MAEEEIAEESRTSRNGGVLSSEEKAFKTLRPSNEELDYAINGNAKERIITLKCGYTFDIEAIQIISDLTESSFVVFLQGDGSVTFDSTDMLPGLKERYNMEEVHAELLDLWKAYHGQ